MSKKNELSTDKVTKEDIKLANGEKIGEKKTIEKSNDKCKTKKTFAHASKHNSDGSYMEVTEETYSMEYHNEE